MAPLADVLRAVLHVATTTAPVAPTCDELVAAYFAELERAQ